MQCLVLVVIALFTILSVLISYTYTHMISQCKNQNDANKNLNVPHGLSINCILFLAMLLHFSINEDRQSALRTLIVSLNISSAVLIQAQY